MDSGKEEERKEDFQPLKICIFEIKQCDLFPLLSPSNGFSPI